MPSSKLSGRGPGTSPPPICRKRPPPLIPPIPPPAECPTTLTMDLTYHAKWQQAETWYEHTWHYTMVWQPEPGRWYGSQTTGDYISSAIAEQSPAKTHVHVEITYRHAAYEDHQANRYALPCTISHPATYTMPPWDWLPPGHTADATLIY